MNDAVVDAALLWFFAAVFLGPLVGWLIGHFSSFERGAGVACLIIGLAGCGLGIWVGLDRAAQLRGTVAVEGRLLEFVEERTRDADRRESVTLAPRVSYVPADGRERMVKGLGGSQSGKGPGDPVGVRYQSANPDQAVVADFQNIWGIVFGFAIFGGLPLMFGTFFLLISFPALDRPIPRENLPPGAAGRRLYWRQKLTIVGNVAFLGAFVVMGLGGDDVLGSLGKGFCVISVACLVHLVGEFLAPELVWQRVGILLIVASGFGLFGVGALLLG